MFCCFELYNHFQLNLSYHSIYATGRVMNKVGLYWQREKVRGRGGPLLAMPSGG